MGNKPCTAVQSVIDELVNTQGYKLTRYTQYKSLIATPINHLEVIEYQNIFMFSRKEEDITNYTIVSNELQVQVSLHYILNLISQQQEPHLKFEVRYNSLNLKLNDDQTTLKLIEQSKDAVHLILSLILLKQVLVHLKQTKFKYVSLKCSWYQCQLLHPLGFELGKNPESKFRWPLRKNGWLKPVWSFINEYRRTNELEIKADELDQDENKINLEMHLNLNSFQHRDIADTILRFRINIEDSIDDDEVYTQRDIKLLNDTVAKYSLFHLFFSKCQL